MKLHRPWMFVACLAASFLVAAASGCARKSAQSAPPAAPAAPAAPPTTSQPVTTPGAPASPVAPAPAPATDLEPVFFDYDSFALDDAARAALDRNARLLRERAQAQVTIEGHCDERGTVEYNQALGERRAQAARNYLLDAGISPTRIQLVSYGKDRPFDEGHDESAWRQNRRAHFVVR